MNKKENKLYLYGDDIGTVELIEAVGSDKTVVNAARISFGVEKAELDERDKKLINYLVKHKHTSTLEHCFLTFKFVVPLFVRSQHHRHRTWSYNEISRRYTDVDIQFYEPSSFRTQHKTNRQASNEDMVNPNLSEYKNTPLPVSPHLASDAIKWHHQQSLDLFNKLLKNGVCREQARGVLPQNLYTQYIGSCSLLNALKFIGLRDHEGAQFEIQQVAKAMLELMEEHYPHTIAAYRANRQEH
jgi:thymidylate synthase (FAD)